MLTLSGSLRVLLALEPCDMRKSFDGLHALVLSRLGEDPRGGAVFCFINRSHTLIKLLHWDGTGLWVHAKKLQRGTFRVQGRAFIVPDFQIMVVIVSGVFPRSDCTLRPVSS